jgi:glycoprotein 3-alpha-L-fucosyltransferase
LHAPLDTKHLNGVFNWTATYKRDSDVLVSYYHAVDLRSEEEGTSVKDKTTRYSKRDKSRTTSIATNFAKGKSKMAVIMVNNCGAWNNRLEYAKELGKHVRVDIFGACSGRRCPGGWCKLSDLAKVYKFYLAFENSNCPDYITEKFWRNALLHNMVPIALGASKADYLNVAPPHSFIHADDFNTSAELAVYLKLLDKNDALYNGYFEWKQQYRILKDSLVCSLCEALHDEERLKRKKTNCDLKEFWDASHCKVVPAETGPMWT